MITPKEKYDEEDMINYAICCMPPEQHYNSVKEIKDDIFLYQKTRTDIHKKYPQFYAPKNKFEKIKNKNNTYTLLPTTDDYSFLFRGQGSFYKECKPSLYRDKHMNEFDVFVEKIKIAEFELMIRDMPIVKYFNDEHYIIDYLGLAQHYGLKTDVLDFTSDLDIALFFAMCDYDKTKNCYTQKTIDKEYIGYLYATSLFVYSDPENIKLKPIGLQPFKRPGRQKGFALHMTKDENLSAYLYSFSYTKKDSELYYKKYMENNYLLADDDIVDRTTLINNSKYFTTKAISLARRKYGNNHSSNWWIKQLKINGFKMVNSKKLLWNDKKYKTNINITNADKLEIENSIIKREVHLENGEIMPCMDLKILYMQIYLSILYGGFDSPLNYDSGIYFQVSNDKVVYGFKFNSKKSPLYPSALDGKIHPKWKEINPIAPHVRSFILDDRLKEKPVFKRKDGVVFDLPE